jgi:hypothetical protein
MAQRDIFMSLSHCGLRIVVRNPLESFPHQSFLNLGRSVMKQVEGTLQPIADDPLCDDADYVRVIDHILGHFRRLRLSGNQGMVQRARSCHSLSAILARAVHCRSFRQCQYKLFLRCIP